MSLIYDLNFNEGNGNQTKETIRGNTLDIHYIFNDAKYKESCSPTWIKSPGSGYALDFDGYSTFIKDEPLEIKGSFTISALVAPRCFEACHGDVSTTIIDQLDKPNKKGFALSLFRHGKVQFELGDGEHIYRLRTDTQLDLYKKSLITVSFNEDTQTASIYINSKLQKMYDSIHKVRSATLPLSIGLNHSPFKISDTFRGGMFSGLIDYIKIYDHVLPTEVIEDEFDEISEGLLLPLVEVDLDERKLLDDIHRPKYHAIPPQHWMNEPHAPFYYKGKYHLFYQKNAVGPYFSNLHWGHWTSDDLVYWQNERTALFPQDGDLTPSGVWSGSATMGPNDIPHLFYTSANFAQKFDQGVAIARPKNIHDTHLIDWEMDPQGVITQTDDQGLAAEFRDPFVWKDEEEEKWYLIIGGGIEDVGPTVWVYTSNDCENWHFNGEFFTVDSKIHPQLGTNWELPVFLPVQDDQGNQKYVFIFMSYFNTKTDYHVDTYYYLGEFDKTSMRFIPDSLEPKLMDYGKFKFSGPSGFVDPVTNKSIVFSILQGNRSEQEEYDSGWAHNAGLPIELYMENGELRIKPLENLVVLRDEILLDETEQTIGEINKKLRNLSHKMLEIIVEFEKADELIGLELKKDPTNQEKTTLIYDREKGRISLDRSRSRLGFDGDIQGGLLELDEGLRCHIYIDHSAVECYFNDQNMLSSRAYPTLENSDHLSLIGDENILIKSIKIFTLKSIWENKENK